MLKKYKEWTSISELHGYLNAYLVPYRYKNLVGLSVEELQNEVDGMTEKDQLSLYGWANNPTAHKLKPGSTAPENVEKTTAPNPAASRKNYLNLLDSAAKKDEWNEEEWLIRLAFFEELEAIRAAGKCSGCQKNALKRKYMTKLRDLHAGK